MRALAFGTISVVLLAVAGTLLLRGQAQERTRDGQLMAASSAERYGSWRPAIAGNPLTAQATAPDVAVVRRSMGTRILDELSKTERRLEVIDDGPAPFWGGTPGGKAPRRELQALTQQAHAVVVGQIERMHSSLSTDQWLQSTVDLRIDEVLKSTDRGTPIAGSVLRLRVYGGRLQNGEKEIVAKRSWAALPEDGRRYLYFLVALEDGSFLPFPETAIFEQTPTGLRRLGGEGVDPNQELMAQVSLEEATDIARAAARLPLAR